MSQTISPPPVEVVVPVPQLEKGEREYRAFLRLLPELLEKHRGQYVAIHGEQVVDTDKDDIALVQRVHARVGYVPIFVGLVSDSPPLVRVPHYRAYHARGEKA
jgi:hypothetical protein